MRYLFFAYTQKQTSHNNANFGELFGKCLICYLAFALSRYVQHQLKTFGIPLSIDKIRDELFQVEASIINIAGQTYRMPSKLNKTGDDIYRAMGISRSLSTIKVSKKSKCSEKKKTQIIVA